MTTTTHPEQVLEVLVEYPLVGEMSAFGTRPPAADFALTLRAKHYGAT